MKVIYFIALVSTLVFYISCSSVKSRKQLEFNSEIMDSFDKNERKELSLAVNKFENYLPDNSSPANEKYSHFFYKLNEMETTEKLFQFLDTLFISFDIESTISQKTFNKIWTYDEGEFTEKEIEKRSLSLKYDSAYKEFLKKLAAQKGGIIKNYYESFDIAGYLSPAMVAMFQKQYELLDLSDVHVRLVISIHYLTLSKETIQIKGHETIPR